MSHYGLQGQHRLTRYSIGRAVVDLGGEEPAKASLLKCIGNVLIMTTIEAIAEVHVFAEKSGLGTEHMTTLIETMFPRPPHTVYSSKMTRGDYYKGKVRPAQSNDSYREERCY